MAPSPTIYYGSVINPESLTSYKALPNCLLSVGPSGNIDWIIEDVPEHLLQGTMAQMGCIDVDITVLQTGEFLIPGFIDTHTVGRLTTFLQPRHLSDHCTLNAIARATISKHWKVGVRTTLLLRIVSFVCCSGQQYELLDWLNNVTFPTEAKFSDIDFARRTYESVVRRVVDSGVSRSSGSKRRLLILGLCRRQPAVIMEHYICKLPRFYLILSMIKVRSIFFWNIIRGEVLTLLRSTGIYWGKRHCKPSQFTSYHSPQKCNMDRQSPDYYVEPSADSSIADTKELITHIRSLTPPASSSPPDHPLVRPILTPRFAPSCTRELLTSLGKLASADPSLHIQTHISENKSEIELVKSLFPEAPHYAGVYDSFGLLRANTVLAHGVHLEEAEVEIIAQRRAGISHCPTSNFNLSSGIAPIGIYLDRGIKVSCDPSRHLSLKKQFSERSDWELMLRVVSPPRF
jgi:guanine deaminase